jgi:hypothetical protein
LLNFILLFFYFEHQTWGYSIWAYQYFPPEDGIF